MNTEQLLAEYKTYLLRLGRSAGTLEQRLGDMRRLATKVGGLSLITNELLDAYLDAETSSWSPAYRKKVYASYRSFFYWARKRHLISHNPSKKLETVRVPRYLPRPAPEEVVLDAFDEATLQESAMLCLGATQGLRRNEIATVHPRNRNGNQLRVLGKGSKERIVPLDRLTQSLLEQLEAEQGTVEYYFRGRFGGHLHPSTVYKWLKKHLGSEWSTHNLRHRAATIGLRSTRDIRGVQELLGHATISSTQIYTAVEREQLNAIIQATSLQSKIIERRLSSFALGSANKTELEPDLLSALQTLAAYQREDVTCAPSSQL